MIVAAIVQKLRCCIQGKVLPKRNHIFWQTENKCMNSSTAKPKHVFEYKCEKKIVHEVNGRKL